MENGACEKHIADIEQLGAIVRVLDLVVEDFSKAIFLKQDVDDDRR
jgi:hypothetical protein